MYFFYPAPAITTILSGSITASTLSYTSTAELVVIISVLFFIAVPSPTPSVDPPPSGVSGGVIAGAVIVAVIVIILAVIAAAVLVIIIYWKS